MSTKVESSKVSEHTEVEEVENPEDKFGKEEEATKKKICMPQPPSTFPQKLVKKTNEDKYCKFISMLK